MTVQFDRFTIRADGLDGRQAAQYEATILGMLRSYQQMATGRAMLNGFRFYQREVLIYPYDGRVGECNAWVDGTWGMFRTKISFSASDFVGASACLSRGFGTSPHEVLYHEMVHALRDVAGKRLSYKGRSGDEAMAIMVANIFSSEVNRRLRHPVDVFIELKMTSSQFVERYGEMVRVFHHNHPDFCRWMAEIKVPFNPLRAYYLTLKGVPRLVNAA